MALFYKASQKYGKMVAEALKLNINKVNDLAAKT